MATFTYRTKITVTVYGIDNQGHVNPAEQVNMTLYGACFKHAIRKVKEQLDGAFYTMGTVQHGDYGTFSVDRREAENIRDELIAQDIADKKYAEKREKAKNAALREYDKAGEDISLPMSAMVSDVDA
jgi:hypothetical protein